MTKTPSRLRRQAAVAVAIAATALLAGCGGDASERTDDGAQDACEGFAEAELTDPDFSDPDLVNSEGDQWKVEAEYEDDVRGANDLGRYVCVVVWDEDTESWDLDSLDLV